ncbi:MAG TPA: PH domain-containing protein [Acidimicrobiales bacterium]|nr:PH domain-containing protein [Acidimicrobiales bacterium]
MTQNSLYDDGRITLDDQGLVIRWYYLWGSKKIPYRSIRSVRSFTMSGLGGKWRIWGSGDFVHWWNLDSGRPKKDTAIEIDLGRRILPTISPDDPQTVIRLLEEHVGH